MQINIPISVAELFDKVSILEIKADEIHDVSRKANVHHELKILLDIITSHNLSYFLSTDLYRDLKAINKALWDVCELRRRFEQEKRFNSEFIEQSRFEYKNNDRRAAIKVEINQLFGSDIVEVKSYANLSYQQSAKNDSNH